jgi:hypothetical protein
VVHKPFLARTLFARLEHHLGAVFVDAPLDEVEPPSLTAGEAAEDATVGHAPLDPAWVAAMRKTAVEGDILRLETLVAQIETSHSALAGRLAGWITNFAYDRILEMMENLPA